MPTLDSQGRQLAVNEEGFLLHPEEWNEQIAMLLARNQENLDQLTDEHWFVIRFIRQHFLEHHAAPMVRSVCKATGVSLRAHLPALPQRPGQRRLQAGRPAQARRLRVGEGR